MDITSVRSLLQVMDSSKEQAPDAAAMNPMTLVLQAQARQLTLSAIGKGMNRASQVASASGDAEVKAGFQQAISAVTTGTMTTADFSVLQTINTLATKDPDTLRSVLSTVNSLTEKDQGSAVRGYLTTVSATYAESDSTAVTALNAKVAQALTEQTDDASIQQALSDLFQQYLTSPTTISIAATRGHSTEILAYQLTAKL
jgi:hypothetical protein